MTVTLGSAGGASVPNWQLLQTSTPTGVATVTFSGLSGYSKYRVFAPNLVPSATCYFQIRFNGDSATNYNIGYMGIFGGTFSANTNNNANSIIPLIQNNTLPFSLQMDIDHALLLTTKFVSGTVNISSSYENFTGNYITTSTLTSITIFTSANNFSTGSIYLLGAN